MTPVGCPHADLRAGFPFLATITAIPSGQVCFGHARQQPAQPVVPLVERQRRPAKRALPGRRSLRLP